MIYLRLYLNSLVPWLVLGTMALSACGSSNNANTESNDSVIAQDTLDQTTSKQAQKNLKNRKPGEIPFDFPIVNTTAKK